QLQKGTDGGRPAAERSGISRDGSARRKGHRRGTRQMKGVRSMSDKSAAWVCGAALLLSAVPGFAQFGRGTGDWSTTGADRARSSWGRTDAKISVAGLQKPGFSLIWKVKLDNGPSVPSLLTGYIGYRGFRSLGYVGTSADKVFALDTDLGRIEWQKQL